MDDVDCKHCGTKLVNGWHPGMNLGTLIEQAKAADAARDTYKEALEACVTELENIAGWSGSAGNFPLHDALTKARKALGRTP